jgi:hypothetical protein
MLRFFKVEDRTLKRHISIGVFVVYIDTGSSMPIIPSKSRDLADENKKILTNGNDSKQPNNIGIIFHRHVHSQTIGKTDNL